MGFTPLGLVYFQQKLQVVLRFQKANELLQNQNSVFQWSQIGIWDRPKPLAILPLFKNSIMLYHSL